MHRRIRIAEMVLELLELLARTNGHGFALVQALNESMLLILQPRQFLLELGTIPIKLQEPLVGLRRTCARQQLPDVAQPVRNAHDE
jgi:hypothetical protein